MARVSPVVRDRDTDGHHGTAVVVERRPLVRLGLIRLLRAAGVTSVAACSAPAEIAMRPSLPNVLVVYLESLVDGLDAEIRRLRDATPGLRVLGVGTDGAPPSGQVFDLLASLDGFVNHPSAERVRTALRYVLSGYRYFEGPVPAAVWQRMCTGAPGIKLSERDLLVLRLLGQGFTDLEVAETLGCSVAQVKANMRAILRKTGARNRAQAVATALRGGWIE